MKLTTRQQKILLNCYRQKTNSRNNFTRYSCSKCKINSNTLSKNKFVLYNTKQNKIIDNVEDIFSTSSYSLRWLEAYHYWPEKNDYVIGESAIKLIYFNNNKENSLIISNKNLYPMGGELNLQMLFSTQQEIDEMLNEYNKDKKHKTKWIKIKSKELNIYDPEILQETRIEIIRRYRHIQDIEAETWISKNIDNLKLFCLNCS